MTEDSDLWLQMTMTPTLFSAWEKVRSNRGAAGGDGVTITEYSRNAGRRIARLSQALREGIFEAGPYRMLAVPKSKGGFRMLAIPSMNDRIAHTALAQTLTPVLEPQFEHCSFAYRPGKSVNQAVSMIERWRDAGYAHVIEADIVQYFDNIRHEVLLAALTKALAGSEGHERLLDFIAQALEHQADELGTPGRGLAQGAPSSPILANLYLDILDEKIESRGVKLVRFADDFVILCKRRKTLPAAIENARSVLAELGLELHDQGTGFSDFDKGFEFLGHLFVQSLALKRKTKPRPAGNTRPNAESVSKDEPVEVVEIDPEIVQEKGGLSDRYDKGPNILYVTDARRKVALHNSSIAIKNSDDKTVAVISHQRIDRIEIASRVAIDPDVLAHCLANGIELYFINGRGEQLGRLIGKDHHTPRLQHDQAMLSANPGTALAVARAIVDARIRNQRAQLYRLNRRQQLEGVKQALERMKRHLRKLDHCASIAQFRGIEGAAGAEYWPASGLLCEAVQQPFRRSRPAKDPLNATINYFTAMLERDTRSAMQSVGLHPGFGILHAVRDYAEAGVYDLMEPFRAALTEGLAIYLFNARRLKVEMFAQLEGGGVNIGPQARKAIITGYEKSLAKRVSLPGTNRKLAWRPVMRHQAVSLAKAARKQDAALFEPFLMDV